MLLELSERNVAKRRNAGKSGGKAADGFFALGAAAVVFAGGKFVLDAGIADREPDGRGQGEGFKLEGTAIELEGMRRLTVKRDELVHDANAGAGEIVFGVLAESCELDRVNGMAREIEQGERRGNLDGSRGTEAHAEGNITCNQDICSGQLDASLLESGSDAKRIIAPRFGGPQRTAGEVRFEGLREIF